MHNLLLIGIGGALGSVLRYTLGIIIHERHSKLNFPTATFLINISGSFLLGIFTGLQLNGVISADALLFIGTGFFGGFTTFSTFGYETFELVKDRQTAKAISYVCTTLVLGVIAATVGLMIV